MNKVLSMDNKLASFSYCFDILLWPIKFNILWTVKFEIFSNMKETREISISKFHWESIFYI